MGRPYREESMIQMCGCTVSGRIPDNRSLFPAGGFPAFREGPEFVRLKNSGCAGENRMPPEPVSPR